MRCDFGELPEGAERDGGAEKAGSAHQRGVRLRLGRNDKEPCMKRVVFGLGTNLGDRRENLRAALAALSHLPKTEVENLSSVLGRPHRLMCRTTGLLEYLRFAENGAFAKRGARRMPRYRGSNGARARRNLPRCTVHGLRCFAVRGLHTARKGAQCAAPGNLERAFVLFPLGVFSGKECVRLRFWTHRALKTGTTCSASARRKKFWIDIS